MSHTRFPCFCFQKQILDLKRRIQRLAPRADETMGTTADRNDASGRYQARETRRQAEGSGDRNSDLNQQVAQQQFQQQQQQQKKIDDQQFQRQQQEKVSRERLVDIELERLKSKLKTDGTR